MLTRIRTPRLMEARGILCGTRRRTSFCFCEQFFISPKARAFTKASLSHFFFFLFKRVVAENRRQFHSGEKVQNAHTHTNQKIQEIPQSCCFLCFVHGAPRLPVSSLAWKVQAHLSNDITARSSDTHLPFKTFNHSVGVIVRKDFAEMCRVFKYKSLTALRNKKTPRLKSHDTQGLPLEWFLSPTLDIYYLTLRNIHFSIIKEYLTAHAKTVEMSRTSRYK